MAKYGPKPRPPAERFWEKVDASGDCWEWTAAKTKGGYGQFFPRHGSGKLAHRWVWEHLVGPIPDGYWIDHLCRNRACVNPDHLEPVTPKENHLRGYGPVGTVARTGKCQKGLHTFDGSNILRDAKGLRRCRACSNEHSRNYYYENRD